MYENGKNYILRFSSGLYLNSVILNSKKTLRNMNYLRKWLSQIRFINKKCLTRIQIIMSYKL